MEPIEQTSPLRYLDKLKMHYIELNGDTLSYLNGGEEKGKFNQRVIVKINQKVEWQGGVVALGEGKGYIAVSKARMKELDIHFGDEVNVEFTKDFSEFGHAFPIELNEILKQDPFAHERFFNLTAGKQRTLIYYILQMKTSDKRIERSLTFMHNLKRCEYGKETMRRLFGKE
jgi:hypothetical protein